MKRMKTFLTYALLIAAFWIVTDLITYMCVNGTYKDKNVKIYVNTPQIIISESKATYVNGYVKGNVKNNTEEIISNKYLKIDMYSARDVNLGTKYVKIENLKANESQDFEMWYKFTDVNYVKISITENIKNVEESQLLSEEAGLYFLIGTLFFLYLI